MADYFFNDHTPSAMQGEPRLCITQTPTVTLSTIGYRLSAIGYRLSAIGYDKPSAMQGEARLRGLHQIISSTTIRPRLWNAKPACAGYGGLFIQRP
jgi:hypothetical protein